jgi:hypothetical protein
MLDGNRVTQRSHERTPEAEAKANGTYNCKPPRAASHECPWTKSKERMTPADHQALPKAERSEA